MTAIRSPEAAFTRPVTSILNPLRDGLVGEFVFGGSAGETVINRATRGPVATITGSPTFNPASARFANASQTMDTKVPASMNDHTMIVVARGVSGFGEVVLASDQFAGLIWNTSDRTWRYNNSQNANPPQAASQDVPPSTPEFYCVIGTGVQAEVPVISVGAALGTAFQNAAGSQAGFARSFTNTFRVAPSFGVGSVVFDIAYLGIYDRALTARERLEVYAALVAGYGGVLTVY